MPERSLAEIVVIWFGGGLILFVGALLLWAQLNKENPVDLSQVIMDQKLGKVTGASFGLFVAMLVSSWMMVYLTVTKDMTEGYITLYLGAWSAVKVLMSKLKTQDKADPPPKQQAVQVSK